MTNTEYKRWYDKDSRLKEFMSSLEDLDEYSLYLVAKEFLQIILSKYPEHSDSSINAMNSKSAGRYNRWYDWNYDLHTCIEYLKDLEEADRHQLIEAFKEICIQLLTNYTQDTEIQIKEDD